MKKSERNFDEEIKDTADHKYAYSFDFDVMHPLMIRSFQPYFREGSCLELGSFQGDFTKRLLDHFAKVTCVEASKDAIAVMRKRLGDKVECINSTFEKANLNSQFDNICFTHVLEHLDDPVSVLKRINSEWLSDGGRLFLACPNAMAPSRQIAVKMGLISHPTAVTDSESEHGHRRTYDMDLLVRHAKESGLHIEHRSGIFFKSLANFQWDKLLKTDIVSKEYLEGCFELGKEYPELCSTIFLVCRANRY